MITHGYPSMSRDFITVLCLIMGYIPEAQSDVMTRKSGLAHAHSDPHSEQFSKRSSGLLLDEDLMRRIFYKRATGLCPTTSCGNQIIPHLTPAKLKDLRATHILI
jgi:hypothetical protein